MIQTPIDVLIVCVLIAAALTWLAYTWRSRTSRTAKVYWTIVILLVAFGEVYFGQRGETISEITIANQPLWLVMLVTALAPIPFALHWIDLARKLQKPEGGKNV